MQRPEQQIHKAVVEHLRVRGVRGLVWWHPPNGGGRGKRAARARHPGIHGPASARCIRIIALHDGRVFALELKADNGRASEAQLAFLADMERAGACTCLARGIDAAVGALEQWGLLR